MEKKPFNYSIGYLTRPDGCVVFSKRGTTVIAGVYGPVEIKYNKMVIDKAVVECHLRHKMGIPGVAQKFVDMIIKNICESSLMASLYPRTTVTITIQELENKGHLISNAVNAACLACLKSGIDMKYMFAAATCFLIGETLSFLPPDEKSSSQATFVFVFNNVDNKIIASHTEGQYSEEIYMQALNMCLIEAKNIFKFFKQIIIEEIQNKK